MSFLARIAACHSPTPLAGRVPLLLGAGAPIGWLRPDLAEWLPTQPGFVREGEAIRVDPADPTQALAGATAAAAALKLLRQRREMFDVRRSEDSSSLAVLDRGAIPAFGVIGQGVHLNGLVRRPAAAGGLHLWVGVRARTKAVAPGQLDNIVAGGTPAGLGAWECLIKEADEEAALPETLVRTARPVSRLRYSMVLPDGLRRDVLHVFDLDLPEGVEPTPHDDEVERFELWPAQRVLEAVRDTEGVKFNVNLVMIDLFLREGLIDPDGRDGRALRAALQAPSPGFA